jgi:hypothetical protein
MVKSAEMQHFPSKSSFLPVSHKQIATRKQLDFQGFTHFPHSFPRTYVNQKSAEKVPVQIPFSRFSRLRAAPVH